MYSTIMNSERRDIHGKNSEEVRSGHNTLYCARRKRSTTK